MIEAKETLTGSITSSSTLGGTLNKAIEYISPTTQEKIVTPKKEQQIVVPDDGVFALSKVTVEPIPDEYLIKTIPDEYQQVEYIESTGIQYVNTGLKLTQNHKLEMSISYTDTENNKLIFGSRTSATENNFGIVSGSSRSIVIDFDNYKNNRLNYTINEDERLDISINNKLLKINDFEKEVTTYSNFTTPNNAYLFNCSGTYPTNYNLASMRLYSCKIYDGDNLIREFIPCYHKEYNEIGLYDLVNNIFYTNIGTGEFIKGQDVPNGTKNITNNGVYDVSNYYGVNVNVQSKLQSKSVIPSKENQNIMADDNYDGLSNVIVEPIPSEYIKPTGTLDITTNGIHNIASYEKANVNIRGDFEITDVEYLFYAGSRSDSINEICSVISKDITNTSNMFYNDSKTTAIPLFDTSNVTKMMQMFYRTSKITTFPNFDTTKVTNMSAMCERATSLTTFPQLNTSNVKDVSRMFYETTSLIEIPLLDFGKVENLNNMFYKETNLITLDGFKDLGKAYAKYMGSNYYTYTLNLSSATSLTHDSLMNVINNLYDIASVGVPSQQLTIGATNLAKLTEAEIAIATNKGWTVS